MGSAAEQLHCSAELPRITVLGLARVVAMLAVAGNCRNTRPPCSTDGTRTSVARDISAAERPGKVR